MWIRMLPGMQHVRYPRRVFQMFSRDGKEADVENRHMDFQSWSLLPWQRRRNWGQKPLLPASTQLWSWELAWGVLHGWHLWDGTLCLSFETGPSWEHSWKVRELFARIEGESPRLKLQILQFSSGISPHNLKSIYTDLYVSYEEIIYPSYSWCWWWSRLPPSAFVISLYYAKSNFWSLWFLLSL